MSTTLPAEISTAGESAVRVTGRTGDRERDWRLVHQLARHFTCSEVTGFVVAIPTYESVLLEFDAALTGHEEIIARIAETVPALDLDAPLHEDPRHFRVPVLYGGEGGPDLERVAEITGLSAEEVIAAHCAPTYTVRCLGAPGGSPMLDGPSLPVAIPRLASPRTHVPQGAVSLAGRQATITPAAAPGGWCVIGRTPLTVLDLDAEPLVPYRPGDTLRFEPASTREVERLAGARMTPEEQR